jgi:hypothetical protein
MQLLLRRDNPIRIKGAMPKAKKYEYSRYEEFVSHAPSWTKHDSRLATSY